MTLYAVVATNSERYTLVEILGVADAVNPEDAVAKVADEITDKKTTELLESSPQTVKGKFAYLKNRAKSITDRKDEHISFIEGEKNECEDIVVWEISAEYPEGNLQLEPTE